MADPDEAEELAEAELELAPPDMVAGLLLVAAFDEIDCEDCDTVGVELEPLAPDLIDIWEALPDAVDALTVAEAAAATAEAC